jgi:hypothetical protein
MKTAMPAYFSVKILWGLLAGAYSKNCAARRAANPNPQNATVSDRGRFFGILRPVAAGPVKDAGFK